MQISNPRSPISAMQTSVIANIRNLLARAQTIRCKRKERAMHLCETLSLGDRRFLALVKVGEQKFLVGAAGHSISLLTELPSRQQQHNQDRLMEGEALPVLKECGVWK